MYNFIVLRSDVFKSFGIALKWIKMLVYIRLLQYLGFKEKGFFFSDEEKFGINFG